MRGQYNLSSKKRWCVVRELSEKVSSDAPPDRRTPLRLTHVRQSSLRRRSYFEQNAQIDKTKHQDLSEWPPTPQPL
jgi:hypothetical protein